MDMAANLYKDGNKLIQKAINTNHQDLISNYSIILTIINIRNIWWELRALMARLEIEAIVTWILKKIIKMILLLKMTINQVLFKTKDIFNIRLHNHRHRLWPIIAFHLNKILKALILKKVEEDLKVYKHK